jgi:hypothetical protein
MIGATIAARSRSARRQFQRPSQRLDSRVDGSALDARVAEVVKRRRVLGAGAVLVLDHRRGGLRHAAALAA